MLDRSIHDGIITHAIYVVTVTEENYERTGDKMFAVSSHEKLTCTASGDGEGKHQDVWAACTPMRGVLPRQKASSGRSGL